MKRLLRWFGVMVLAFFLLGGATLGVAYYYKSQILEAVNAELRKDLNGDVRIGGLSFSLWDDTPGLAITLHDIYLRGPNYNDFHKDLFSAKKVYVSLRLMPLLHKTLVVRSVRVEHGSVYVFRTREGYSNTDVFRVTKSGSDSVSTENRMLVLFKRIRLQDVAVEYYDSMKNKAIGFRFGDVRADISQTDSSSRYALQGPMYFVGLTFNPDKGSYLKEQNVNIQWNLEMVPTSRRLVIHPSSLVLNGQEIGLHGEFSFGRSTYRLGFDSRELSYSFGISLLTQALTEKLKRIEIDRPVAVNTSVVGSLAPGDEPFVDVHFSFRDASVNAFKVRAEEVTAQGLFLNHVDSTLARDDHNSEVRLDSLHGLFQGLPTNVRATFHDLKDPIVTLESSIDSPLSSLNSLVDSSMIHLVGGRLKTSLSYTGRLNEFLDSAKTKFEGKMHGHVTIKDGALEYVPRAHSYQKIDADIAFTEKQVLIDHISFLFNKSPVTVKGELLDYVPFFNLPDRQGSAKVSVYSPSMNMQPLLTKATNAVTQTQKNAPAKKKRATEVVDGLTQKVKFDVTVQLDKVTFGSWTGFNMKGRFMLDSSSLTAQNVRMNLADGDVTFSLKVTDMQKRSFPLSMHSTIRKADIKKYFYSFNNFNQTTLTHENIEGTVAMQTDLRVNVDQNLRLVMSSLYGTLDLSVREGKLINFEPMENMSNFLFKRRDFSNVAFGEIRGHWTIKGSDIDISRMEIQSTVMGFFLEGRYGLKGNTDLSVQIPLSNLKRRDKDYKPQNVGIDKKVGMSVYLHVYNDDDGKTQISYDPFKKHVRKSTASN